MATPKSFSVKIDRVRKVVDSITKLASQRVLVGIPSEKTERDDDQPITNAAIGYLAENGSPETNLPPRPWLKPTVKKNRDVIIQDEKSIGKAALEGKDPEKGLIKLGLHMQRELRAAVNAGIPPPLSPRTVAGRMYQRGTKRRKGETKYLELIDQGVSASDAQKATGLIPYVNTGQFRNSINFVIRKK